MLRRSPCLAVHYHPWKLATNLTRRFIHDHLSYLQEHLTPRQPPSANTDQKAQRSLRDDPLLVRRLLGYAPHSGYGQQMAAFSKAIALACALNRSLVLPPLLFTDEVTKGSCNSNVATPRLLHHKLREFRGRRPSISTHLDLGAMGKY